MTVQSRALRDEDHEILHFFLHPYNTISLLFSAYFMFGNISIKCECSFDNLIQKTTRCETARKEFHETFLGDTHYKLSVK